MLGVRVNYGQQRRGLRGHFGPGAAGPAPGGHGGNHSTLPQMRCLPPVFLWVLCNSLTILEVDNR